MDTGIWITENTSVYILEGSGSYRAGKPQLRNRLYAQFQTGPGVPAEEASETAQRTATLLNLFKSEMDIQRFLALQDTTNSIAICMDRRIEAEKRLLVDPTSRGAKVEYDKAVADLESYLKDLCVSVDMSGPYEGR